MTFFIASSTGELLFTNGGSTCRDCMSRHKGSFYTRIDCPVNHCNMRFGSMESKGYFLFLCSDEAQTKTTALFKEKINMLSYVVPAMLEFRAEVEKTAKRKEVEKYSKVVHNLKSLNAQSILAQYRFISQDAFVDRYDNLFDYVLNEVKNRPRDAAIALFKQAKSNAHMKTEFTSHEKLAMDNPALYKQTHIIRKVILNVYHSFDYDFRENHVSFRITESDIRAIVDYDTVRLAIYHILSNAVKYIAPNSCLQTEISLDEGKSNAVVDFKMHSLYIKPEELDLIFNDHYSGESVRQSNLQGSGLGMGLIKKAILLNGGDFIVIPGKKFKKSNYAENIFRLILPVNRI